MNVISGVFAVVVVLFLLYFGLGINNTMMCSASADIDDDDTLSDSLNSSIELAEPTFNILTMGVWILVLTFVIGGLYLLLSVI